MPSHDRSERCFVSWGCVGTVQGDLDNVASGEAAWKDLLHEFWGSFHSNVSSVKDISVREVIDFLDEQLGPHLFPETEGSGEGGSAKDPRQCPACETGRLGLKLGRQVLVPPCSGLIVPLPAKSLHSLTVASTALLLFFWGDTPVAFLPRNVSSFPSIHAIAKSVCRHSLLFSFRLPPTVPASGALSCALPTGAAALGSAERGCRYRWGGACHHHADGKERRGVDLCVQGIERGVGAKGLRGCPGRPLNGGD